MKHISPVVLFALIIFISCNKPKEDGILIRIRNNTNINFILASTASVSFGRINAGTITAYKTFEKVIAYPGARIVIANDTLYAGVLYCGTPPLPYLEKGKYRLDISAVTATTNIFNANYTKE